ncbi:hypothetical protein JOM56_012568 [Amanita muscaria]
MTLSDKFSALTVNPPVKRKLNSLYQQARPIEFLSDGEIDDTSKQKKPHTTALGPNFHADQKALRERHEKMYRLKVVQWANSKKEHYMCYYGTKEEGEEEEDEEEEDGGDEEELTEDSEWHDFVLKRAN